MSIYRPVCVACQKSLGVMTGIEEVAMQMLEEHYAEHHPGLKPGEGGDFDVEVPLSSNLQRLADNTKAEPEKDVLRQADRESSQWWRR